jgi:hypothetical protein
MTPARRLHDLCGVGTRPGAFTYPASVRRAASIEVAERSLPGVGEEAAPGYSARTPRGHVLRITFSLIAI